MHISIAYTNTHIHKNTHNALTTHIVHAIQTKYTPTNIYCKCVCAQCCCVRANSSNAIL